MQRWRHEANSISSKAFASSTLWFGVECAGREFVLLLSSRTLAAKKQPPRANWSQLQPTRGGDDFSRISAPGFLRVAWVDLLND